MNHGDAHLIISFNHWSINIQFLPKYVRCIIWPRGLPGGFSVVLVAVFANWLIRSQRHGFPTLFFPNRSCLSVEVKGGEVCPLSVRTGPGPNDPPGSDFQAGRILPWKGASRERRALGTLSGPGSRCRAGAQRSRRWLPGIDEAESLNCGCFGCIHFLGTGFPRFTGRDDPKDLRSPRQG